MPDVTTLLGFRRLIEKQDLGKALFEAQNEILQEQGRIMQGGSIVDATIIAAPSSTKNATGGPHPSLNRAAGCRTDGVGGLSNQQRDLCVDEVLGTGPRRDLAQSRIFGAQSGAFL